MWDTGQLSAHALLHPHTLWPHHRAWVLAGVPGQPPMTPTGEGEPLESDRAPGHLSSLQLQGTDADPAAFPGVPLEEAEVPSEAARQ